jgi:hypothetical protein
MLFIVWKENREKIRGVGNETKNGVKARGQNNFRKSVGARRKFEE